MGLLDRFRKSNDNELPPEVKKYYESEHRDKVGLAWLIAFVTLVVTVALVVSLFFGGRWAYRKIAGIDNKPSSTASTQSSEQSANKPLPGPSGDSANNNIQSEPAESSSETNADTNAQSASQAAENKGDESTELSDTGPGNTLVLFMSVSLLGALSHSILTRWRLSKN